MKRAVLLLLALAAVATASILIAGIGGSASTPQAQAGRLGIDDEMTNEQERLLSGFTAFTLGKMSDNNPSPAPQHPTQYFPRGSDACPSNIQSNIKVNQNCLNLTDPDLQGR